MRIDRNIKEKGHDPYGEARKHTEGAYCPECQAVYQGGRWVWSDRPEASGSPLLCSACRRIRDDFPAGECYLSGKYLKKHRQEIENLIRKLIREASKTTVPSGSRGMLMETLLLVKTSDPILPVCGSAGKLLDRRRRILCLLHRPGGVCCCPPAC